MSTGIVVKLCEEDSESHEEAGCTINLEGNVTTNNNSNRLSKETVENIALTATPKRKLIAGKTLLMRRPWKMSKTINSPFPFEPSHDNSHYNQYAHNYYLQQQCAAEFKLNNPTTKVVSMENKTTAKSKACPKNKDFAKSEKPLKAIEISSGKPNDSIEGGWPDGWVKKTMKRMGGKSAGTFDSYWISPQKKYRLRSMKEVRSFLAALKTYDGDEQLAKKNYKNF